MSEVKLKKARPKFICAEQDRVLYGRRKVVMTSGHPLKSNS